MLHKNIYIHAVVIIITTILNPFVGNLSPFFNAPQAVAQTAQERKRQADILRQKKDIESLQAALTIYQEIGDKEGIVAALQMLAKRHRYQKEYVKEIAYLQQALVIVKQLQQPEKELEVLEAIANYYRGQDNYAKTIESLQQMLVLARRINNQDKELTVLQELAAAYGQNNYTQAMAYYQQVLVLAKKLQKPDIELQVLTRLVNIHGYIGDEAKVGKYAQQSLALARQLPNKERELEVLKDVAFAYQIIKNYPKAIDYYKQTLALAKQLNKEIIESQTLQKLVRLFVKIEDTNQADIYARAVLMLAQNKSQTNQTLEVLNELAWAYYSGGNYHKGLEYLQQMLSLAQKSQNQKQELEALNDLGKFSDSLEDYAKVIYYYQQRLKIARNTQNQEIELETLKSLTNAYLILGDYVKAIDYEQQILTVGRKSQDRKIELESLRSLGSIYSNFEDYYQAINYYQQSLAVARQLKNREAERMLVADIASGYFSLKNYTKALEYFQQSLTLARQEKFKGLEVSQLRELGDFYLARKDSVKAISYFQQALEVARLDKESKGLNEQSALETLGYAYLELGDYTKAISYAQQSLEVAQKITKIYSEDVVSSSLILLGTIYYEQGNYNQSLKYAQKLLEIENLTEKLTTNSQWQSLRNLGISLAESGHFTAAEKKLRASIQQYESGRKKLNNNQAYNDTYKVSSFEDIIDSYRTLQKVLIAQNQPQSALEIAEQGRSRVFVDLLAKRLLSKQATPVSLQPLNISQIQRVAQHQKATIVEYSITRRYWSDTWNPQQSELYIWVVKPTGEIIFRQVDLKSLKTPLKDLIRQTRQLINQGRGSNKNNLTIKQLDNPEAPPIKDVVSPVESLRINHRSLQQLHQLLIAPIADLLPNDPDSHVIFIPQDELFLVPFPALQDAQSKFLIEKHTILTAPAIQILDLTHQRRKLNRRDKSALVVGNPTMPKVSFVPGQSPEQLSPLPEAETEAQLIAQMLGTKALIGNQPTKATVISKLPKVNIIHLATHGLLDDRRGLGSSIALAPDVEKQEGNGNGLLTADEILNLQLNAELVVLSACDTGAGKITGDGVIGLSRSFISAGVASVLVSLWAVPDAPTASLMTEFYRSWQQQPDKAAALRQAMLVTMKQHPHPKNWAAFTIIGEAE